MNKKLKQYGSLIIVVFVILLFFISSLKKSNKYSYNRSSFYNYTRDKTLEEQIKLDVDKKETLEIVSNSRKILQYRLKSLGKYDYQDYYYDTPTYDIAKRGYSYRFRIVDIGSSPIEYRFQFKKEYDINSKENFVRNEVDIPIPETLGKKILVSDFKQIFYDNLNNEKIRELNSFLVSQNIDVKTLLPLIYGRQYRDRYRLKEDNITFFEISLDEAYFTHLKEKNKKIQFMQVEFENKYIGGYRNEQPGFIKERIKDLINFFTKEYRMKITKDSKYRKVIKEFNLIR